MKAKTESKACKALRKTLADTYGKGNYRIMRNGAVHVKGVMPNTNITGWYLLGWIDKLLVQVD